MKKKISRCVVNYSILRFAAVFAGALSLASANAEMKPFVDGDVVVFFGDSITHGGLYHGYLRDYYLTRFPEAKIRFVNSGIGGDTADGAYKRLPEDVEEYHPTWVTFHFGMNDVWRGCYLPETNSGDLKGRARAMALYRENLDKLIAGARKAAPEAKFIYLTPTVYDDTAVVTNAPTSGWASFNNYGCNTALSLMAGHVLECAERDGAGCVDWFTVLNNSTVKHQRENKYFAYTGRDRVHPAELGHSVMAWTFLKSQGAPALVSAVTAKLDEGGRASVSAENGAVSDVAGGENRVAFTLLAKALPMPVSAKALGFIGEFDVEETLNLETVTVTGLAEGGYAMKIDGEEVGRYSAAELAKGVRLGFNPKTPQYRQAQEVARRDLELCLRERKLRNHHSARWCFYGQAPVDDIPAMKRWYETDLQTGGAVANGYFGEMIPGYLEYWPKYRRVRDELLRDQEAVRELARPRPHRYEISGLR